ncbi:MAG: DUF488 family protein [Aigarchaeota archaeon]|nr:DUF488 family protein [Candidatus Pelearchaeum maunauluense]
MVFRVKRVYDVPSSGDGFRVLVDRLWPRGLDRGRARVDLWMREVAPSDELRRWFGHDASKWEEFRRRYFEELGEKDELVNAILELEKWMGVVTLLFSARDLEHNNAVVLMEYLIRLRGGR